MPSLKDDLRRTALSDRGEIQLARRSLDEIERLEKINAELLANYQAMKQNRDAFCKAFYEERAKSG